MMKIYTRTGDDGTTGLFGGGRVPKNHPRVEAYGSVDELCSNIGLLRASNSDPDLDALLGRAQAELFALGADLATPRGIKAEIKVRRTEPSDASWMEEAIDRFDKELSPLQTFILPGGDPAAALAHVARAVCRRAERAVVALAAQEEVGAGPTVYLNRLADFLFTLARIINHRTGAPETPWKP